MKHDDEMIMKNVGTLPRTWAEATQNADYATPIWRCESETGKAMRFFADAIAGFIYVWLFVGIGIALFTWLGVLTWAK